MEPKDNDVASDRIEFSITGMVSIPLSIDPKEFKGQPPDSIKGELQKLLSGINSSASYFTDELDLATNAIMDANGEG